MDSLAYIYEYNKQDDKGRNLKRKCHCHLHNNLRLKECFLQFSSLYTHVSGTTPPKSLNLFCYKCSFLFIICWKKGIRIMELKLQIFLEKCLTHIFYDYPVSRDHRLSPPNISSYFERIEGITIVNLKTFSWWQKLFAVSQI